MFFYNTIYLICSILGIYIVYKFYHIFYSKDDVNDKKWEFIFYILYFILINTTYFIKDVPFVMLITNISGFIIISFSYKSTMMKRIFSSLSIYLTLMVIETLIAVLSGYIDDSIFNENQYSWYWGIIASKILSYATVVIIGNFKNLNSNTHTNKFYCMIILIIPISTMYLLILILNAKGYGYILEISAVLIVLLLNFIMLWLYDHIIITMNNDYELLMIAKEKQYYENQLSLVKSSIHTMQTFRHDIKNQLAVLNELAEAEDSNLIKQYVSELIEDSMVTENKVLTGNTAIDSILNYKISEAADKNILIDININIPDKLQLPSYVMVVILGNILDNAITALENANNKTISISLIYSKGRVIIKEQNECNYTPKFNKTGLLQTSKKDHINHGYGLKSIEIQVKKLNGIVKIDIANNLFIITIILYLPSSVSPT